MLSASSAGDQTRASTGTRTGLEIELEELRARAKSMQISVGGAVKVGSVVKREMRVVERVKEARRERERGREERERGMLYEGKAGKWEGKTEERGANANVGGGRGGCVTTMLREDEARVRGLRRERERDKDGMESIRIRKMEVRDKVLEYYNAKGAPSPSSRSGKAGVSGGDIGGDKGKDGGGKAVFAIGNKLNGKQLGKLKAGMSRPKMTMAWGKRSPSPGKGSPEKGGANGLGTDSPTATATATATTTTTTAHDDGRLSPTQDVHAGKQQPPPPAPRTPSPFKAGTTNAGDKEVAMINESAGGGRGGETHTDEGETHTDEGETHTDDGETHTDDGEGAVGTAAGDSPASASASASASTSGGTPSPSKGRSTPSPTKFGGLGSKMSGMKKLTSLKPKGGMMRGGLGLTKIGKGFTTALRERRPSFGGGNMLGALGRRFSRSGSISEGDKKGYEYNYRRMSAEARKLWGQVDMRWKEGEGGVVKVVARDLVMKAVSKGYEHALRRSKLNFSHSFVEVERYMSPERKRRIEDGLEAEYFKNFDNFDAAKDDEVFTANDVFRPDQVSKYGSSLEELYSIPSPLKSSSPRLLPIKQENIWSQVERAFRTTARRPLPPEEPEPVPEVQEEPPVMKVKRVPRVWKERVTWLDELIRRSRNNLGGGDGGGHLGPIPDLVGEGKKGSKRMDDTPDWLKSGESWAGKRRRMADGFVEVCMDKKEAKERADGVLKGNK